MIATKAILEEHLNEIPKMRDITLLDAGANKSKRFDPSELQDNNRSNRETVRNQSRRFEDTLDEGAGSEPVGARRSRTQGCQMRDGGADASVAVLQTAGGWLTVGN